MSEVEDAQEAPADEEAHEAAEAAGQVPDVIRVELVLPREARGLDVQVEGC